jgi:uncharacterized protein (TIGR02231 family)
MLRTAVIALATGAVVCAMTVQVSAWQAPDPPATSTPPAPPAPPAAPLAIDATPMDVDATITAVTLYRGRAAVTRSVTLELTPGVYDLRFTNLPESVQPQTLQARTSPGLKVLSVDYTQEAATDAATSPAVTQIDQRIKSLEQALRGILNHRELNKSQQEFLAALTIRTTSDAANAGGTSQLDLDAVKKQMDFITAERTRLQSELVSLDLEQPKIEAELAAARANREAMVSKASESRTAIVSVVAADPFKGDVSLTYLVANATWEPAYNIRAATDLSSAQIEYDAVLTQRTGEDWDEVRLTLSTAQPTMAANPPEIEPWYVDIARPESRGFAGRVSSQAPAAAVAPEEDRAVRMRAEMVDQAEKRALQDLSRDAAVFGGGPAVTFELLRAITVKTNAERQQTTRIAAFNTAPTFVHVATPMLTEHVYVRGDLGNSSPYHLLPGRTAIFMGQDYIGPTAMPSVPPNGEFKMHFGIDQSVRARRQLASKVTESTGLLSGGRRTISEYRIAIDNGSGRNITLELWDRIPVSRSEEIQVALLDPSTPLANDAYYATEQQPQGLLKWWLSVPAGASERNAYVVSWTVRIDRAKDVQMTPLPE